MLDRLAGFAAAACRFGVASVRETVPVRNRLRGPWIVGGCAIALANAEIQPCPEAALDPAVVAAESQTRPLWLTGREPKRDRIHVAVRFGAEYVVPDFDSPSEDDEDVG